MTMTFKTGLLLLVACVCFEAAFTAPVAENANPVATNRQLLGSGRRRRRRRKCSPSTAEITNVEVQGAEEVSGTQAAAIATTHLDNCAGSGSASSSMAWTVEATVASSTYWDSSVTSSLTVETEIDAEVVAGSASFTVSGQISEGGSQSTSVTSTMTVSCSMTVAAGYCLSLQMQYYRATFRNTMTGTILDDCGDSTDIDGELTSTEVPTDTITGSCTSVGDCSCSSEEAFMQAMTKAGAKARTSMRASMAQKASSNFPMTTSDSGLTGYDCMPQSTISCTLNDGESKYCCPPNFSCSTGQEVNLGKCEQDTPAKHITLSASEIVPEALA